MYAYTVRGICSYAWLDVKGNVISSLEKYHKKFLE